MIGVAPFREILLGSEEICIVKHETAMVILYEVKMTGQKCMRAQIPNTELILTGLIFNHYIKNYETEKYTYCQSEHFCKEFLNLSFPLEVCKKCKKSSFLEL